MPAIQVKPTRMELSSQKKKLKVAVRGHKLMKDKRDEMVKRFIVYVRQNRDLRLQIEEKLSESMQSFVLAKSLMSSQELEEAFCYPAQPASIETSEKNVLSVSVPIFKLAENGELTLPYGFMTTNSDLDVSVKLFAELLPLLIKLAEVEKTCNLLAFEIEKTRRRVNALEYVMIPQFTNTIRRISMKLDENERGNLTRLMKTKEMLNQKK